MLIRDTITRAEIIDSLEFQKPVGVFATLFNSDSLLYDYRYPLSVGYYASHSALKRVSPLYEQILAYQQKALGGDSSIELTDEVASNINKVIAVDYIRPKFEDKWNKIYEALIAQYNPLNSFDETTTKTGTNEDKTTYDTTVKNDGSNEDKITYNNTVESDGTRGTKETTTSNRENSADVYGFNSSVPVGDTVDNESVTETLEGKAEDNTSHNTQTKSGDDTKNITIDLSEKKTGTETKNFTIDETMNKSGRNTSAAKLIEKELSMRDREILFDIIYRDIDSILTLGIY